MAHITVNMTTEELSMCAVCRKLVYAGADGLLDVWTAGPWFADTDTRHEHQDGVLAPVLDAPQAGLTNRPPHEVADDIITCANRILTAARAYRDRAQLNDLNGASTGDDAYLSGRRATIAQAIADATTALSLLG